MPYTEQQRKLFNEAAENVDAAKRHGMSQAEARKLADEANCLAGEGREKKAAGVGFVSLDKAFGKRV